MAELRRILVLVLNQGPRRVVLNPINMEVSKLTDQIPRPDSNPATHLPGTEDRSLSLFVVGTKLHYFQPHFNPI
nr:hypothetical protein Iba_chr02bCG2830 [Ipomoea batatas]GMC62339.1 hypothetical protein Iba_chr02cCG2960 [Ipomoea batatas]